MKVYAFIYNSNIHESAYVTMSLHFTRGGANRAKNEHKKKAEAGCLKLGGWATQEINIEQ